MLFKDDKVPKIKKAVSDAIDNQGITNEALLSQIRNNCYLAGGAIRDIVRGREPKDFDIYFTTEFGATLMESDLIRAGFIKSDIGTLYKGNVQFITCVCGPASEVVDTFDFTINQGHFGFLYENLNPGCGGEDLIYVHKCRKPMAALIRVAKFIEQGYTISESELAKIGASIIQLQEPKTYQAIKELFRTGSNTYKKDVESLFPKVKEVYELELKFQKAIKDDSIPF